MLLPRAAPPAYYDGRHTRSPAMSWYPRRRKGGLMFYYFGRKGRLAPHYPAPRYSTIVEPFAGSMAYTMHYQPDTAIGVEADPVVVSVWHETCAKTPAEILEYSNPEVGSGVRDRWAMFAAGSHGTSRAHGYWWTERMSRDLEKQKRLAARLQPYARTVDYRLGVYTDAPDIEATWFIDPPYKMVKRGYGPHGLDYDELADWCRSRRGQVIVCEQEGADWLPFKTLTTIKGTNNKRTTEVVWLGDSCKNF